MMRALIASLLLLLVPTAAPAAIMFTTCATLPAALEASFGGDTFVHSGDCAVQVKKLYSPPVTLFAEGATLRGLRIEKGAGGFTVIGGTIRSPEGAAAPAGPGGYGAAINGSDITLDRVTITDARKGLAVSGTTRLRVTGSTFRGLREDGMIASTSSHIVFVGNTLDTWSPYPTTCTVPGAPVVTGLSSKTCVARGGKWKDGDHPDGVQLRDGVKDSLFALNVVNAPQGIGIFDTTGDALEERIVVIANNVTGTAYHSINLGARCLGCVIRNNITSGAGGLKAPIRFDPTKVLACGNTSNAKSEGTAPCL